MKQKTRSRVSTGVFILTVVGIIVLVNMVSVRMFGRIDLTDSGMFSLSDASKDIMRDLDDQVYVKAYFTSDLPAPYNSHTRFVKDLFEEYAAYSKGKFSYEFIDPGEKEDAQNEMMLLGIPPVQIQEIRDDKFQVRQAFLGIVFYYEDKKEVIPLVKSTTGLEYEITSTIRRLTSEKLRVVGFLQGHGEPKPSEEMKQIHQLLSKYYEVRTVDLSAQSESTIPDDVETLIIQNPTEKFEEDALKAIDQFLMSGRTIAFFVDSVAVDLKSFQARNLDTDLNKLLGHYGISVNQNLIADLQNQRINVSSQQGMYRVTNVVNYPLIPIITDFNEDSTLVQKLDSLPLPFVSSLEIAADTEHVSYEVLARTSSRSWLQQDMYKVNPMEEMIPSPNAKSGPFPVIATAQGRFRSYYAEDANQSGTGETLLKESPETRILVIGDGSFALDQFGDRVGATAAFFTDCVDWLLQDEALISIRGRGLQSSPITELESWQKSLVKYMNMIGIPFLLILFGLLRWQIRRARRKGFDLASK